MRVRCSHGWTAACIGRKDDGAPCGQKAKKKDSDGGMLMFCCRHAAEVIKSKDREIRRLQADGPTKTIRK